MRKATPIVITCALLAGAIAVALAIREPDTISFHYDRLLRLQSSANSFPPSDFKGYFRLETLSWYLRGRPPIQRQIQNETQALIRLDYFEQREFSLQHRLLDRQFADELYAACGTAFGTNYLVMIYDEPARKIRVIIRKDCMSLCENIITELDRKVDQ